jgi:hypothetical protein
VARTEAEKLSSFGQTAFNPRDLADKVLADAAAISNVNSKAAVAMSVSTSERMIANAANRIVRAVKPQSSRVYEDASSYKFKIPAPTLDIPIPLPIESGDIARETTQNRVVQGINDVADKIVGINIPTFPHTFHIDAADDIARETTQKKVVGGLTVLDLTIKKTLAPLNQLTDQMAGSFTPYFEEAKKTSGLFVSFGAMIGKKIIDVARNNIPMFDKLTSIFDSKVTPLISYAARQTQYLKDLSISFKRWFEHDMSNRIRESSRDTVTGVKALGLNIYSALIPENSQIEKALKMIAASASFFGAVGGTLGGIAFEQLAKLGVGAGSGLVGGLGSAIRFILLSSKFMGGIVGLVVGAALYSLYKDPAKVGEYINALSKIWTENIAPTFEWLYKEVLQPVSAALASWWNSSGESAFLAFGDFINNTLIYLLGTAIPTLMSVIGKTVKQFFNMIGDLSSRIVGIFGFGENGADGVIGNLMGISATLFAGIIDGVTIIASGVLKLFKLDDAAKWLEEFSASFKDAFLDIVEHMKGIFGVGKYGDQSFLTNILGYFNIFRDSFMSTFGDLITNLLSMVDLKSLLGGAEGESLFETLRKNIVSKVQSLMDGIMSIIPSWDDIKRLIASSIPENIWGRDWLMEKLGSSTAPTNSNTQVSQATNQPLSRAYRQFAEETPSVRNNITVVAPVTQNNQQSSSVNVGGGNSRSGGGVPSTRPDMSTWDRALYFAPGSGYIE